jgi:hypothetical protein
VSVSSREDTVSRRFQYPKVVSANGASNVFDFKQTAEKDQDEGEISFVLERDATNSPAGGKLGMFTLALIMCICCCSTFFSSHQHSFMSVGQPTDG